MFDSLRLRMAVSHGAVLAAIVIVLGGVGYVLLQRNLSAQATAGVVAAAREGVDRVNEHDLGTTPPDRDTPSAAATRVAVFRPDGTLVGEASDVPSWLRPQPAGVVTIEARGEPVRVATIAVESGGRHVATVVAARSLAPEGELLDRVRLLLIAGGLAAVLASASAGWWLAGRALRPVRRAYEAQANFAADASHELRTPLAFVRAGVEVLAEGEPGLGGEVLEEVDYLTGLTNRLLTMARADSGSLGLRQMPVPLEPICRRALERSRRAHGVEVRLRCDGHPVALADPVAVAAVLDAVLENVARHGGGTADLACAQDDGRVHLSVADHGPGLPLEHRRDAFERFFRADPVRGREGGGAGLGLAIARELLLAQHGSITLRETPGGGLTAEVELPAGG